MVWRKRKLKSFFHIVWGWRSGNVSHRIAKALLHSNEKIGSKETAKGHKTTGKPFFSHVLRSIEFEKVNAVRFGESKKNFHSNLFRFEIAIFVLIFLNMLTMGIEHYNQPHAIFFILEVSNAFFTTVFGLGNWQKMPSIAMDKKNAELAKTNLR